MGVAPRGPHTLPGKIFPPVLGKKARKYPPTAPKNPTPPAVIATPLTSGVPQLKAIPSGARSSVVPTDDFQRIFPAFKSTATIVPHGGLLQRSPSGESATARVIANGAPRRGPKSLPGRGLKPS